MTLRPPPSSTERMCTGLAVCAAGLWLWLCFCLFPLSAWNDVRLEPSFLLARGLPVYPSPNIGAVTTWIYGPLPVLLLWPATFAHDTASALLTGGAINLFFTAGVVALVCACSPAKLGVCERVLAFATCVALWPAASFQYIQADNYAVACGLLSNLILMRGTGGAPSATRGWLAALAAAGAIMCKQTSGGIILAQCLWLAWIAGPRAGLVHAVRAGTMVAGLLAAAIAWFGPQQLWFNLVQVPGHLPWTQETAKRLLDLAPLLAVHVLAPAAVLIFFRRHIWRTHSPLLLPSLTWCCVLPGGLAGILTLGGTLNSIQGLHYLLPPLMLVFFEVTRRTASIARKTFIISAGLVVAIVGLRVSATPLRPLLPLTSHLKQGESIARQLPGQIWFPWNPLITIYTEGKFYHAEDGLYVRFITGYPLTYSHADAHLPDHWLVTALPSGNSDWGLALNIRPVEQPPTEIGMWHLYRNVQAAP
ncbi:MAG: hypothetical protein WC661_03710 [Opitutaceae bacterium]